MCILRKPFGQKAGAARPTTRRRVALTVTREKAETFRRDRARDAGVRAFSRRSRPRVSPASCRPRLHAESGRARLGAARASRVRARAPGRARARKKARKKARSFFRSRKLREPRGWGARAYLAQGAEPLGVDRGLVHEDLLRAVVGGDEPEPLLGVEPLHLRASPAEGRVSYADRRATIEQSIGCCCFARQSAARSAAPEAGKRARGERGRGSSRAAPRASYLAGELRHRVSRWELRRRERRACCNGAVGG